MRFPKTTKCLAGLVLSVAAASTSFSVPITFFGESLGVFSQSGAATGSGFANAANAETNFLALLSGVGTESFESYADGTAGPLNVSFAGAGTASLQGGGAVDDDPSTGQNAVQGSKWWRTGAGNDFTISFTNPVSAFGFYGIDVGDIGAQLTLTLAAGSSVNISIPHTIGASSNGAVFFFGYIDPDIAITKATFSNPSSGDDFGFDKMTIGSRQQVVTGVPDAGGSALLLGLGLAGVAIFRRKLSHC